MPKRVCECGYWFRLGDTPNQDQWLIISDVDFDGFFAYESTAEEIYKKMKIMLKCPECGRLSVFWGGSEKAGIVYKKDEISGG